MYVDFFKQKILRYNMLQVNSFLTLKWAFLVTQMVKCLSAMLETWVRSLGREDPLEKEVATLQYSCLENPVGRGAW